MTDPMIPIAFEIPTAVAHKISETAPGTLAETALIALRLYHGLGLDARTTLTELATHHSLTPAKTLRLAIEQLKADTTRLQLGTGVAGRPVVNTERDADIYARTRSGVTHAAVAAEYGISLVRVGQIVAKQRAMRNDPVKPATRRAPILDADTLALDMASGISIAQVAAKYSLTVDEVSAKHRAYRANLPANPNILDRVNAAREVLSLEVPEALAEGAPPAPRKLAVIPPSMKNPELFATKEIKIPDFANLDNRMFEDDYPI